MSWPTIPRVSDPIFNPPILGGALLPIVGNPPASPVNIDPGVEYPYVIPVRKETSIAVQAKAGFEMSIAGRTLTIEYINPAPATDLLATIVITCTNALGSTQHRVDFNVKGGAVRQINTSFEAACISGSLALRFGTDDLNPGSAIPIAGKLAVGSKIKAVERTRGAAVTGIDGEILWIVAVNDALGKFQVSGTEGGPPIVPDQDATYQFVIATVIDTSELIYVDNSSQFVVAQPIQLSYTDSQAMPPEYDGLNLFVHSLVGSRYIKVTDAVGNPAIASSADSFATDQEVNLVADSTGGRLFPAITSDSELTIEEEVAIADFDVTSDIAANSFAVLGLPFGLSFDPLTNKITGTPSGLDSQTRVVIVAYKGSNASYRYLLLNKVGGDDVDLAPDAIYDIADGCFYSPRGPSGRGDMIKVVLNQPPISWGFDEFGAPFIFPAGSSARVIVKKAINSPTALATGTRNITADTAQFHCGEDWTAGALVAELGVKDSVDLWLWFAWRKGSDAADRWRQSRPILLRLYNDPTVAGTDITGSAPSTFVQSKPFSLLIGGTLGVALDSVVTVNLAVDTWRAVVDRIVDGARTESIWLLVEGDDAEDPAAGVVRPDDYANATNEKIWVRVSGL